MDVGDAFGMGSRTQKIFWLGRDRKAGGGGHYAFRVDHPAEVDAFHAAALAAGGKDNGKPGPRPDYGPHYYAAFVKDREGNNIEVVCYARSAAGRRRRLNGGRTRSDRCRRRSPTPGGRSRSSRASRGSRVAHAVEPAAPCTGCAGSSPGPGVSRP